MSGYVFDATQHEPDAGMEVLPAGTYNVKVDSAARTEMKPGDDGESAGWYLKVVFAIVDGALAGRKFHNNYNVGHKSSAQAAQIAHGQLSALCHVIGVMRLAEDNKFQELVGKTLKARIDSDGKYNSLKEVFDVNGNKPSRGGNASAVPAGQGAPAAAAGWGAQPAQQPAAIATPSAPAAAPVAPQAFPPEGWQQHPQNPAYYWKGEEVLDEAALRARFAPPAAAPSFAAAAPAVPAAAPAAAPAWNQAPAAAAPAAGAAPWGPRA